jgi:hypothetical protein
MTEMVTSDEREQSEAKIRAMAQPLFELFYLPGEDIFALFDQAADGIPLPYSLVAGVFRTNLESAMLAASIPYTMVSASVHQRRFDSFLAAARIRQLKNVPAGSDLPKDQERQAYEAAMAHMDEFRSSKESIVWFRDAIVAGLSSYAESPDLRVAAEELPRSVVVMTWGTFEAFVSDALRVLLNGRPVLAAKLMADPGSKKHLPMRDVSVEALASRDFNVSSAMGDILLENRQIESLPVMKDILNVAFPTEIRLREVMSGPQFWLLWQKRHLIVHKRGIVDASYLSKTSDALPLGSRLQITGEYVREGFLLVREAAGELIATLRRTLDQDSQQA